MLIHKVPIDVTQATAPTSALLQHLLEHYDGFPVRTKGPDNFVLRLPAEAGLYSNSNAALWTTGDGVEGPTRVL
jgi:hypothetical protein